MNGKLLEHLYSKLEPESETRRAENRFFRSRSLLSERGNSQLRSEFKFDEHSPALEGVSLHLRRASVSITPALSSNLKNYISNSDGNVGRHSCRKVDVHVRPATAVRIRAPGTVS
jgi:hypothetical protein